MMMIATIIDYEDDDEQDENKNENDNDDNDDDDDDYEDDDEHDENKNENDDNDDNDDDWSNADHYAIICNHQSLNSADQIKVSCIFCHQVSETKVNAKAFPAQGSQWVQYTRTTQKLWWSMVWQSVQANMPNNKIQIQGFPGHKATNFEYQSSNQKKPEKRHASSCSATLLNINIAILIPSRCNCSITKNAKNTSGPTINFDAFLNVPAIRTPQWSLGLHDGVRWVDGVLHIFCQGSSRSQGSSQTGGLLGMVGI